MSLYWLGREIKPAFAGGKGFRMETASLQNIWSTTSALIKNEMTDASFSTYIKDIRPFLIIEKDIILEAPSDDQKAIIKLRYESLIRQCVDAATNGLYDIKLIAPSEKDVYLKKIETPKTAPISNSMGLNPKYTFDNYVVGNSNQLAHMAALNYSTDPNLNFSPLFIYGGVGLGKTHLMHAIGHQVLSHTPSATVLYVPSEQFVNELISSLQPGKSVQQREAFRRKYRDVDVLLIDDIQFIGDKESTQEEFFHTFNELYSKNKRIVISSDRVPQDIPKLQDRLQSRFACGLSVDISPPDLETRVAILWKKAETENIKVSDDVCLYIASMVQSNIRELEGSLMRVLAYSTLTGREVDALLAEEALKNFLPSSRKKKITSAHVQKIVADYYNISQDELLSQKRSRGISYPRQIAMYLLRDLTDLSLPKIGNDFGGRDHTTVLHAVDKIQTDLKNDNELKKIIQELVTRIKE